MNTELKKKWTDALRSGEYNQGRYQLARDLGTQSPSFCCLGVLAKVAGMEIDPITENDVILVDGVEEGYEPIRDLIGERNITSCMRLNDQSEFTFPEIADWIEENIVGT